MFETAYECWVSVPGWASGSSASIIRSKHSPARFDAGEAPLNFGAFVAVRSRLLDRASQKSDVNLEAIISGCALPST